MKRNEFRKFLITKESKGKSVLSSGVSVTDPTFARSGRELIFQPLNIEYRMKYPEGVPLDKKNPFNIAEFDKIYPDKFKAIQSANKHINETTSFLDKKQKELKQKSKTKPEITPESGEK